MHRLDPDRHPARRRPDVHRRRLPDRDRVVPQIRQRDQRLAGQLAAEGGLDPLAAGHRAHAVAENADVEIVARLPRLALRREEQFKQDLVEHPRRSLGQGLPGIHPRRLHRIGAVEQEHHTAGVSAADVFLVHEIASVA